jgi:hypothetical protein
VESAYSTADGQKSIPAVAPNAIGASRKQLFVYLRATSIRKLIAGLSRLADDQARRMPVR